MVSSMSDSEPRELLEWFGFDAAAITSLPRLMHNLGPF